MKKQGTNLSMIRGDSESITFFINTQEGTLHPLTQGDILYFTVKEDADKSEIILQKIITEFPDGIATFVIDPIDTKNIPFGRYVYDIQLTRADGTVKTVIEHSNFTIRKEVTHD